MFGFVGSHYGEFAAVAATLFLLVLAYASIEDALKRRRS
jgi:hypothetical protein